MISMIFFLASIFGLKQLRAVKQFVIAFFSICKIVILNFEI